MERDNKLAGTGGQNGGMFVESTGPVDNPEPAIVNNYRNLYRKLYMQTACQNQLSLADFGYY
jgi:hypothetical protein